MSEKSKYVQDNTAEHLDQWKFTTLQIVLTKNLQQRNLTARAKYDI